MYIYYICIYILYITVFTVTQYTNVYVLLTHATEGLSDYNPNAMGKLFYTIGSLLFHKLYDK